MMRTRAIPNHLAVLAACLGALLAPVAASQESDANVHRRGESHPARPNIIIVMADDMGFSDLGCYGGEIQTPTIDRLAAEGVRFASFYNCSICGPSRASLMTGCYPWLVGQPPEANIFANLTGNCVTLPEVLRANGYQTAAVGRLDMVTTGNWHDPTEVARGLDRFLGSASGGPGNYFKTAPGTPWLKDGKAWERPVGPYSTDLITDFVVDFIAGSKENPRPFFVYISHYAPHWPLQAKDDDIARCRPAYESRSLESLMATRLERQITSGLVPAGTTLDPSMVKARTIDGGALAVERMAIHAAMVESIDRSLAAIIDALSKADQIDNTLVLVFSDNGASSQTNLERPMAKAARPGDANTFLTHGPAVAALSNTPLRGYKTTFWEGGIASPLVAWWPKCIRNPGRTTSRLSHIADIMPTCLELAGVSYPSEIRGRKSILPAGRSFVSTLEHDETLDHNERVLVWPKAVRCGDWKLVLENVGEPALFNIGDDRNERNNIAAQNPDRVRTMLEAHATYFRTGGSTP